MRSVPLEPAPVAFLSCWRIGAWRLRVLRFASRASREDAAIVAALRPC